MAIGGEVLLHRPVRLLALVATLVFLVVTAAPATAVASNPPDPYLFSPDAPFTRSRVVKVGFVEQGGTPIDTYVLSESGAVDSNGKLATGTDVAGVGSWTFSSDGNKTLYGQVHYTNQPANSWTVPVSLTMTVDTSVGSALSFDLDPGFLGSNGYHVYDAEGPAHLAGLSSPTDGTTPTGFIIQDPTWTVTIYSANGFATGSHAIGPNASVNIVRTPGVPICPIASGTYTVHQVSFEGPPYDIDSADVDFSVQCNSGAHANGTVRYGSSRPVAALGQSADSLAFAGDVGTASSPQTVTVTNLGTSSVSLGQASIGTASGFSFPGDFALAPVSDQCSNKSLGSGGECTVQVVFTAGAAGNRNAILSIPDATIQGQRVIKLLGSGNPLPAGLEFTRSGSLAAPGPITLTATQTPGVDSNCPIEISISGFPEFHPDGTTWTNASDSSHTVKAATFEAPPGDYTATASTYACGGRQAAQVDLEFTVTGDATPPVGSVVINDGSSTTNDANVTVHLSASDSSGITKVAIASTTSPGTETWVLFDPLSSIDTRLAQNAVDGLYNVMVRWRDGAANWSDPVVATVTLDETPPTVQAPLPVFVANTSISGGKVAMDIPVEGTDNLTGVADFDLGQKTGAGAWKDVPVAPSTSLAQDPVGRLLAPGNKYTFRVRATDVATNASPWAVGPPLKVKKIQESSARLHYSSGWTSTSNGGYWGGHAKKTTKQGATVSLTFTGTSIAWVSRVGPDRGAVQISIDGVRVTLNLYSPTVGYQRVVWTHSWSTRSTHTVTVKALSSGQPVELDAFLTGE